MLGCTYIHMPHVSKHGHTDTPFISSTNWKKDRIIHLPVGSVLDLLKYGVLTEGRSTVSRQLCRYLAVGWG